MQTDRCRWHWMAFGDAVDSTQYNRLRKVLQLLARCCDSPYRTPPRAAGLSRGSGYQPLASLRSSIRSRSTSQNLSDDRRSLSISSAWADSLSSIGSGCGVPERLLNFRGLRLNFNVRHLARFGLGASINHSPLVNPFC